jgi:hypothetical protein
MEGSDGLKFIDHVLSANVARVEDPLNTLKEPVEGRMYESVGVGEKTEESLGHGAGTVPPSLAKGKGGGSQFSFSHNLFQG